MCMEKYPYITDCCRSAAIWMRMTTGPYVWMLPPSRWNCLRRPRRCGLLGGSVPLWVGSEVQKPIPFPFSSLLHAWGSRCKCPATAPAPCLPACHHDPHHYNHVLWSSASMNTTYFYNCLCHDVLSQQWESNAREEVIHSGRVGAEGFSVLPRDLGPLFFLYQSSAKFV